MRQTPLNALLSASLPACVARTGALTLYSVGIVVLAVMAQTGVPRLRAELAFQGEVCGASALTAYQYPYCGHVIRTAYRGYRYPLLRKGPRWAFASARENWQSALPV
jgi:hypothetical protein